MSDKDFDVPLANVQVLALESGQKVLSGEQGSYVLPEVQPGTYTLVFTKDGYTKFVRAGVLVQSGKLTDLDVELTGEFTDMEEFVVQDLLQFGAGSEAALLQMRFDSPALLDSIGSDLMSRAGAGDAASALRLVAGASVQGGKFAVIRGLPDRYVSSQMNGVRLPSADEDKRAVELDQFPATVLESIQVSKTFTPDQQGDASGGAVNVRLKGIPSEYIFQLKAQTSYNSQVTGASNFLTYKGGGLDFWGRDDGGRDIQTGNIGGNWSGAVGVERTSAPVDYKWSIAYGNRTEIGGGVRLGGYASLFYERDSTHDDNRRDDSYWVENPGGGMVPQTVQGSSTGGDFKTALFDIQRSTQSVQLGGLGILGLETDEQSIALTTLYTRNTEDSATLAQDTRGKAYFFPGYDVNDSQSAGNLPSNIDTAPYLRLETLQYTERTTGTLQLNGKHKLSSGDSDVGGVLKMKAPELSWTLSHSTADLNQPDKRQFGALWHAASYHAGVPPFTDPFTDPPIWLPYKPGANFNFGNLQRIWKDIGEDSDQVSLNLELPFEQWNDRKGSLKLGFFDDSLHREYDQHSFGNFGDAGSFLGDWSQDWADTFPSENHPITESTYDVNYRGKQQVSAWYSMLDMPVSSALTVTGGARFETTTIGIVNIPGPDATWYPPGTDVPVALNPGDADVTYRQSDVLPALALSFVPAKDLTLRASYSQTVAHQTFKEITPIAQQEFLGGPVFIGNPDLRMSALENYDLRADYVPYEGGLWSVSWFQKNITDTIEYVQRVANSVTFTTPVNYPKGKLYGYEFEVRQDLEHAWSALHGLSAGANATFIHSRATLPESEADGFSDPGILAPMATRDMTDAPEHLYNLFLTYDFTDVDTQVSLFYTIQGDTLVAGAGEALGNFVPNLYAKEYDTLNLSLTHGFGKNIKLGFQAKNLTNPSIEEVYRSSYIGSDVTKTSYTKGIELSLGLTLSF
ncbi:MAG: TonB-dependent receptor [Planctomycetes bacterium]|nr:TonB-dependent receptor [Planctomycetota bacterium]